PFDDDDVVRVDLPDGLRDAALQVPQRSGPFFRAAVRVVLDAGESPVRLVDHVVAADPRLVLVALGELPPEGNGLRLIGLALPEGRLLRVLVVDVRVLALAAG